MNKKRVGCCKKSVNLFDFVDNSGGKGERKG